MSQPTALQRLEARLFLALQAPLDERVTPVAVTNTRESRNQAIRNASAPYLCKARDEKAAYARIVLAAERLQSTRISDAATAKMLAQGVLLEVDPITIWGR